MNIKTGLQMLLLVGIVALTGCRQDTSLPVSPLQSPLAAVSPLATATTPATARPVVATPELLLGAGFDPAQAVLTPDDMSDLFVTSYGITQPYGHDGMRGIQVTYPTKAIEHTTAFAEGFETRIEVYDEFADLVETYYATIEEQAGDLFEVDSVGDDSRAFRVVSDVPGTGVFYVVIARRANALAIITVKPPDSMQARTLERIANTVIERLSP